MYTELQDSFRKTYHSEWDLYIESVMGEAEAFLPKNADNETARIVRCHYIRLTPCKYPEYSYTARYFGIQCSCSEPECRIRKVYEN